MCVKWFSTFRFENGVLHRIIRPVEFPKITLVGVGLLGGSVGLAVKQRGMAGQVTGYVRRVESVEECLATGAVDEATQDLEAAVTGASIVILCTPVGDMEELAAQLKPHLSADAVITDVGSVKASVVHVVESVLPRFVGSHPMCGSEKAGVAHARGDLFEGAACAITPTDQGEPTAVETVSNLWTALGSNLIVLTAEDHDAIVARTSHLPHVLATALVNAVIGQSREGKAEFLGTGFRDTTRLASGSPNLWRDIALTNAEAIADPIDGVQNELQKLQAALHAKDAAQLEAFFAKGQTLRDDWLKSSEKE